MAGINDIDLSAATVVYNGVTFGGSTAAQKSLPPRFKLSYVVEYDETRRVVKGLKYTLSVQTIFYEDSQGALATNQSNLRALLSAPAKELRLLGLGLGFASPVEDLAGGPHPIGMPEMRMLSENAWELLWSIEFTVHPCYSPGMEPGTLIGFNYETTWANDYEGTCTRSISGHYEIIDIRNRAAPNTPHYRADFGRSRITIVVPNGFRRMQNAWHELASKRGEQFAITDQQMVGDPYPVGIIEASGDETFTTDPKTWAKATVTMSVNFRVAPGTPRTVAGQVFLAAAMAKQAAISSLLPADAAVIPSSLSIRHGKFQDARNTSAAISWTLTKCVQNYLSSSGLWAPITPGTYTQWRTSIENLWANRGNANVVPDVAGDVILDLCASASSVTIPADSVTLPNDNPAGSLSFTCPPVGVDGGWIGYDLRVRAQRSDHQTQHRRAVTYSPSDSTEAASDGYVPTGGPSYDTSVSTEHIVEYNGLPSTIIILRFKGFRYRNLPTMPEITSVAGKPVTLIAQDQEGPFVVGDLIGCPYYAIRGYRIYRVNGHVATIRSNGQKTSCANSVIPTSY